MTSARPLASMSAADLDDPRLQALAIDPGPAARVAVLAPAATEPCLVLGLRGSGKTHALRLWSWPVAGQRAPDADGLDLARADGCLAVHFRPSAFDARRYRGRGGASAGAGWQAAFARQIEWRMAERLLAVLDGWRRRCGDAGFDDAVWRRAAAGLAVGRPAGEGGEGGEGGGSPVESSGAPVGPIALLGVIVDARRRLDIDAARAPAERPPALPADPPGAVLRALADAWAGWHPALVALPLVLVIDEAELLPADQLARLGALLAETVIARDGSGEPFTALRIRVAGRRELAREPAFAGWPRCCWDELLRRQPHWPVLAQALLDRRLAPGALPPLAEAPGAGLGALIDATAGNPGLLLALFDRLALLVWQRGFRFGGPDDDGGIDAPLPAALQAEALAATARDFIEPPPAARGDPRTLDARRAPPPAAREALRRLAQAVTALAGATPPRQIVVATGELDAHAAATLAAVLDAGWLLEAAPPAAADAPRAPEADLLVSAAPLAPAAFPALPARLRVIAHPLAGLRLGLASGAAGSFVLDARLALAVFGGMEREGFARLLGAARVGPTAGGEVAGDGDGPADDGAGQASLF
ncbi:hypothetical protein [Derxia gummosa]|uniref:Uncharacterized protein n=1 Tax=Derxia gummosa DSM 723 TaxID=1121388 RepID=A0A8B6X381_9BURK|nr:hypothetical protein [Derxia gummosa]